MARRKRIVDEPENNDRWMVSYADFVTLLFAFFVVMYSVSSVNTGKYKILSDSLDEAFSKKLKVPLVDSPIQLEKVPTSMQPIQLDYFITAEKQKSQELSDEILLERQRLKRVSEQLEEVLQPFINQELIEVKKNDLWLELEMKSEILFSSGEAELSTSALPVLRKIIEIIRQTGNVMQVEGHTDNIPIDTVEFPSNWDLSSARAASLVKEFVRNGINPKRLAAVGYGEFHPIADNKFEQGRFKNRRVVLVLLSQSLARYGIENNEREKLLDSTPEIQANSVLAGP